LLRISDVAASRSAHKISTASRGSTAAPGCRSAFIFHPAANAVTTAKAVQATLQKLSERFPAGLTYLVQYDSTTFVRDTHHEVLKTLGEAFILVVIVVFSVPRQSPRHRNPPRLQFRSA